MEVNADLDNYGKYIFNHVLGDKRLKWPFKTFVFHYIFLLLLIIIHFYVSEPSA